MRLKIIILSLFVYASLFAQERQLMFERYTTKEGLSHNYINTVYQDKEGYIWLATRSGLDRFDGYSFKRIHGGLIMSITEDVEGNIWVATTGDGLLKYDKVADSIISFLPDSDNPNSISTASTSSVLCDDEGNIIINSEIIERYNPVTKVFDNYGEKLGLESGRIFQIQDGKVVIAFRGVVIYDKKTGKSVHYKQDEDDDANGIPDDNIRDLYIDKEGIVWIAMRIGLIKLDSKTGKITKYLDILESKSLSSSSGVNQIFEDNNSNLWLCTSEGLILFVRSTGDFIKYQHDPRQITSISDNAVISIIQDKNGLLWVGTRLGLNKVINNKFVHYYHGKDENSIVHNNVHSFYEQDGKIWVGTSKGLDVYDTKSQLFLRDAIGFPEVLTDRPALYVTGDHSKNIWVGTWGGGVTRYTPETNKAKNFIPDDQDPNSIIGRNIFSIFEDSKKRLWIGTWGNGLSIYNSKNETFLNWKLSEITGDTRSNNISFIFEYNGLIWIGSASGIYQVVDFNNMTLNEVWSEDYVTCNYITKDNILLIGDGKGLFKWDNKNKMFARFEFSDLLVSTAIKGILEDSRGNLWLSSGKGLSKVENFQNKDSVNVINYKIEDGLQGDAFLDRACLLTTDSIMYFGGTNGFNRFDPNKVSINSTKPIVHITGLKLFNKTVNIGDTVNGEVVLDKSISYEKELELSYKNNFVTIEFSAIHYQLPYKNQYKYMLEGFDDEWTEVDASRRFGMYTDLKGGEYLFKVKASNSDGIWNEVPKTLHIIVIPPFWRTWWFYTIVSIMAIVLVVTFIRMREKQMQHDKMLLEDKLRQGEEEINKQKDEILKTGEELKQREEEGRDMKWYNEGLALFSDLISRNKGELKKLNQSIIAKLIEYVEAEQGAIYTLNDDNESEPFLELSGSYALDAKKISASQKVLIGESLVGTCFKDKEVKQVDDIPEGYTKIGSGLGSKKPNYLLLVPIRLDESVIGVIELASFKKIDGIKITFLVKLAESITSIIMTEKANDKMQVIIEHSKLQATQMQEQEEEMRQNLEELRAQQEEAQKIRNELMKKSEEQEKQIKTLLEENEELKKKG